VLPFGEGDVRRNGLNHIGAALAIENLTGAAHKMRERSTVFAVADDSVHAFWMAHVAFESPAIALQVMIHC
jgi:hypothetical protein